MSDTQPTAGPGAKSSRWRTRVAGLVTILTAGAALVATATLLTSASASAAPATAQRLSQASPVPTKDIVGKGLFNCKVATGEVGYSPASIAGGKAPGWISIWFKALDCASNATTAPASPLPKTVMGAMSFPAVHGDACPQFQFLGQGTLNLTYNYSYSPTVPNPMLDPSYGTTVTVTEVGPYWVLKGLINGGSYQDPSTLPFVAWLKPDVIGGQNCKTGITSEYIARAQKPYLEHI
jgi:hypothetical protein